MLGKNSVPKIQDKFNSLEKENTPEEKIVLETKKSLDKTDVAVNIDRVKQDIDKLDTLSEEAFKGIDVEDPNNRKFLTKEVGIDIT